MRILCAAGARRSREVVQELSRIVHDDELIMLHVIDSGPRHDLDRLHGPLQAHHDRKEALVVLYARETPNEHPKIGPPSVGHTARFVVDLAPAHVLLPRVRPTNEAV